MKQKLEQIKIRDGFVGSKQIELPKWLISKTIGHHPLMHNIFLDKAGYYPCARYHNRVWKNGCPDNILIYCVKGEGWFKKNHIKQTISKNQFILISAGTEQVSYGADEDDPWTIYWIHFTGSNLAEFNQVYAGFLNRGIDLIFDSQRLQLWNEIFNFLSEGFSFENLYKSNFCAYQLISSFLCVQVPEETSEENQMVKEVIRFMQANIEKKVTSEMIAKEFNFSESHIRMLFKRTTGIPINEYLISLRVQKSSDLLRSTDLRIMEIYSQLGFSDPYYFSRCFKQETGLSPLNYRKQFRKK